MTGVTWHQPQPRGAWVAMAGKRDIGIAHDDGNWTIWRCFYISRSFGKEADLMAARAALEAAWADWMAQAGLTWTDNR